MGPERRRGTEWSRGGVAVGDVLGLRICEAKTLTVLAGSPALSGLLGSALAWVVPAVLPQFGGLGRDENRGEGNCHWEEW